MGRNDVRCAAVQVLRRTRVRKVLTKADSAARSGNGEPTDNNGGKAMSDSHSSNAPDPTRRKILAALAGSVALSACGGGGGGGSSGSAGSTNGIPPDRASLPRPALPAPATSGIDHIVLVTMENRSFDHMFGWVPNAEHQQARQFTDAFGQTRSSFALTSNDAYGFQACSFSDPNHLYSAGRTH